MNEPSSVVVPASPWLRTWTGFPAMPDTAPASRIASSTPWARSFTSGAVRSYPASSPYPIVTNLATRDSSLSMPMCH